MIGFIILMIFSNLIVIIQETFQKIKLIFIKIYRLVRFKYCRIRPRLIDELPDLERYKENKEEELKINKKFEA